MKAIKTEKRRKRNDGNGLSFILSLISCYSIGKVAPLLTPNQRRKATCILMVRNSIPDLSVCSGTKHDEVT